MLFNILQTSLPQLTPPPESVNVTDSVKVAAQNIATEIINDPGGFAEKVIQELIQFGFKVLAALAIYVIGAWVIRRLKRTLEKVLVKRHTEKTLASFITSLVSLLLTIFLVMLTIGALGLNTTSIAAMLGAGVMAIGMALSGTMENFAGGLIILMFKPFKAGDFISVQGYSGTVTKVSIVNTEINTPDNRCIVIPNGAISNGTVDNFSVKLTRRIDIKVGVEYGTDADACLAAMKEIALADERVLDSKTYGAEDPFVALASFEDSSISMLLRIWVKAEDYWNVTFDMNKALYSGLTARGFNFAYPHMDVTLKQ